MQYKLGIDVGGTFTDFLLVDEQGSASVYKSLTTPEDPSEGVLTGMKTIAESQNLKIEDFLGHVSIIVHGTTITTNAVLTRRGSKTGFITTKGFRDPLVLKRGVKKDQYNFQCAPPPPIVPRYLVKTVEERLDFEGNVVTPLQEEDVYKAIGELKKENVEAVGVTLLFSFLNAEHEKQVGAILKKEMPDAFISLSHETNPQVRLYERCSTTALNAYVGIALKRYLEKARQRLHDFGFRGVLLIMQSNGGVMSPEVAMDFPVNTLLSGPAGGPMAGVYYASLYETKDIITMDMGGTSFDTCLVKDRVPPLSMGGEIGEQWLSTPMLDIHTIGSGGGSIAWVDDGGILQVGPQSAGSNPGPVCYDQGGELPTVTDADLYLGYLNPDYFAGGKIKLNLEKTTKAIKEQIARPLGVSTTEAAEGIYRLVYFQMSGAISVITTQRGFDPRDFALITAGGAGPLHAAAIAENLGITRSIVPRHSSVFCAEGMLMSDLKHEYVRTYSCAVEDVDFEVLNQHYKDIVKEGLDTLISEGIAQEKIEIEYVLDLRYVGQYSEISVPFQLTQGQNIDQDLLDKIIDSFHKNHDILYGYALPGANVQIVNLRVSSKGITEKPKIEKMAYHGEDASGALKGKRKAFFDGDFVDAFVYDLNELKNGNKLQGPALLEEATTTILVPPAWDVRCDEFGNFDLRKD